MITPPCEGCNGKRYRLATRSDGVHAVERCDTCSLDLTDDDAVILAGEAGQVWTSVTMRAVSLGPPAVAGKQWTVLVLRPDHMWEGLVRDWTYQAHVIAPDVPKAEIAAREQAATADDEDEPFDYAILAVYAGHLSDVADTG